MRFAGGKGVGLIDGDQGTGQVVPGSEFEGADNRVVSV